MTPTDIGEQGAPGAQERTSGIDRTAAEAQDEPLRVEALQTKTTALAHADARTLDASQSALWQVQVEGDAQVSASLVGAVTAQGSANLSRGVAGAVISEGDSSVSKGGAGLIIARRMDVDKGGAMALVANEAEVRKGYVGLLLARDARISEDSRVIFDWKGALILAAVLAGGLGLVALAIFLVGRGLLSGVRRLPDRLPQLADRARRQLPGMMRAAIRSMRD